MPPKTLPAVLSQVIEAKAEYDVRLLAQQLGTNYRSLMYWLRGDRHLPAYLLPRICTILRNYEPLDLLESQAGRVAPWDSAIDGPSTIARASRMQLKG